MRSRTAVLAAMLAIAPLNAEAADLVVWWDEGYYPQEDEAVREIINAFEQKTGKRVELVFHPLDEHPVKLVAALEAGQPPDFAFGYLLLNYMTRWAFDDRLVDLSDAIGPFSDLFDPDVLSWAVSLNASTGQKALYGLPMGFASTYIHVWKSLLERAGFTLADIPKDWDAFWAFWCDEVQPAVRRATGREDVWGVGLAMSPVGGVDAQNVFFPFLAAYQADYVTREGRLVIDDPKVRRKLVEAIASLTAIWRKGCTSPESLNWNSKGNNDAFVAQAVVMTSFLVAEGWLAHYLDFAGERILPPMPKLPESPFWLDLSDRHRMAAVMQVRSRPLHYDYAVALGNWRHDRVWQDFPWAKAIQRVAVEGWSPEQAVDEAIAWIKQILSE